MTFEALRDVVPVRNPVPVTATVIASVRPVPMTGTYVVLFLPAVTVPKSTVEPAAGLVMPAVTGVEPPPETVALRLTLMVVEPFLRVSVPV